MPDQSNNLSPEIPPRVRDLTGQRFGQLTVTTFAGHAFQGKQRHAIWHCVCDCGAKVTYRAKSIQLGRANSCGCANRKRLGDLRRKHSRSFTPEYVVWQNMKKRCLDPNYKRYPDYGGRGIRVCDRWRDSFEEFFKDMGERPSPKHSIERKNNEGHYEPGNCEWAVRHKQDRNKRNNRLHSHGGRSMTVGDWAKETGISAGTLRHRLESGMPLSEAISRPVDLRYSHPKS